MNLEFVDVVDFLQALGIRNVKENGSEVQYSCPFLGHKHGDSRPSASMQQGSTVAHCFSCGWSGNAISFLAELEGVAPLKAAQWIREEYGDGFKEPDDFIQEIERLMKPKEDIDAEPIQVLDEAEAEKRRIDWLANPLDNNRHYSYLLDRGFSVQTLQEFDIGWDAISERFTIPIRDEYGNLVGFKGRALPGVMPKYKILGGAEYGFDTYPASRILFGLHRLPKELMEWKGPTEWVLCEGELNAIACCQAGFLGLGISGKFLSDEQARILSRYPSHITLVFDEQEDAIAAARKLEPFMPVAITEKHDHDPADMTPDEISHFLGSSIPSILL